MIIEDIQCDGNVVPRDLEGTHQLFSTYFSGLLSMGTITNVFSILFLGSKMFVQSIIFPEGNLLTMSAIT